MKLATSAGSKPAGWLANLAYLCGFTVLVQRMHRRWRGPGVRVVAYRRSTADPAGFRRHLKHLRRWYHVIPLAEAVEALQSGAPLPENAVALTCDDGRRDNYTVVMPLLERYGLTATIFVITGALDSGSFWFDDVRRWVRETNVGSLRFGRQGPQLIFTNPADRPAIAEAIVSALKALPGERLPDVLEQMRRGLDVDRDQRAVVRQALTWDELRQMVSTGLFTVGAHTVTRPVFSQLEADGIAAEIRQSCARVAEKLGQPVRFLAYPRGDANPTARSVACEMGLAAFSAGTEGFNPPGSALTTLKRLEAEGLPIAQFALRLAGWEGVVLKLREGWAEWRRARRESADRLRQAARLIPLRRYLRRQQLVMLRRWRRWRRAQRRREAPLVEVPQAAPEAVLEVAPGTVLEVAHEAAPEIAPEVAVEAALETAPEVVAEAAAEVAPEAAAGVVAEAASEVAPEVASEIGPEVAPEAVVAGETTVPYSPAEVQFRLGDLSAFSEGRLPSLTGFVAAGMPSLERYESPYYQLQIEVRRITAEITAVRIEAQITAWYSGFDPSRSGYRSLPSNGRLEADFLDRLKVCLAKKIPPAFALLREKLDRREERGELRAPGRKTEQTA